MRPGAYLAAEDGKDGLGMDEVRVAEVVQATVGEDLGAGLEPDTLTEGDAVAGEDLGGDTAEGAEHGPASMDDLELAVTLESLGVSGEASGVPAVVTREGPYTAPGVVDGDGEAGYGIGLILEQDGPATCHFLAM